MMNSPDDNNIIDVKKKLLIDQSIEKGLDYLYENQLPNGAFPVYVSFEKNMEPYIDHDGGSIIFDAALILHMLNLVDNNEDNKHNKKINEMKTKAIAFLLNNKEQHGVWRFSGKNQLIPPDIDDTSLAFAALVESGIKISDESLDYMLNYRNSDGIFYVWINSQEWLNSSNFYYNIPRIRNNEVDRNVNINALFAYSLRHRAQSEVIIYLKNIIENKLFVNGSPYYPSPYIFIYLVTKTYFDGKVKELRLYLNDIKEYLLKTQNSDGGWGNDLDNGIATTSLINMDYKGESIKKAIGHILNSQHKNGSWDIYSLYIQPEFSLGTTIYPAVYFGARELITSFNLEALIKYQKKHKVEE